MKLGFFVGFPALLALLAGCGGAKKPVGVSPEPETIGKGKHFIKPTPDVKKLDARVPSLLPTHLVASVSGKTLGPFLARREGHSAMTAYIGGAENGARHLVTAPISDSGENKGPARVIAATPSETNALVLRATGGEKAGFVAAWTAMTDRGEALRIIGIAEDGTARGEPHEIARTTDDIVWTEIVQTARGAVCVWAEELRSGDANVLAVSLDPDGRPRGVPSHVAKGVTGWQAVPTTMGAGLALVTRSTDKKAKGGQLSWLRLDGEARPIGAPLPVTTKATVTGDVDVARVGASYVFAWTDPTGLDPEVSLASIDDAGVAHAPLHPIAALGGSSLVALSGGKTSGVIAWEEPSKRGHPTRRLRMATIGPAATLDAKKALALDVQGTSPPELVPAGDGFALLAPARTCTKSDTPADCEASSPLPMFVRLDGSLGVVQVEALRLPDKDQYDQPTVMAAGLAWGLDCASGHCLVLTATGDAPTAIHAIDLTERSSNYVPPLIAQPPADAPRATGLSTLAAGEPYADVASARIGDGSLVALVTATMDEPTGITITRSAKGKPPPPPPRGPGSGATLSLRALDASGAAQGAPVTLTTRALSLGGVAIAGGATPEDGAAVAWVAREGGDPQVHVTLVDRHGKKLNDVLVTTERGDASDVAITWASGGWVVAWVDGRDGNGEVYACHLSSDLKRISGQERVTKAPGDASDVSLIARDGTVWLAWADPRESPNDGFSDIYVAPLRSQDARRSGDEVRVLATAAHSRSPSLAASGDGIVVGWIEEAPMGAEATNATAYGAMIAWLDPKGRRVGEAVRTRGAGEGFPSAIVLDPHASPLRGILARSSRFELALDTLEISETRVVRTYPIMSLDGPPSLDVSLALLDNIVFFNDDGPEAGARRARTLTLAWSR